MASARSTTVKAERFSSQGRSIENVRITVSTGRNADVFLFIEGERSTKQFASWMASGVQRGP